MPSIDEVKLKPLREQYDLVVDSIFGFGFTGAPRPPFDKIIEVCCNPSAPLSNFAQYQIHIAEQGSANACNRALQGHRYAVTA